MQHRGTHHAAALLEERAVVLASRNVVGSEDALIVFAHCQLPQFLRTSSPLITFRGEK